MAQAAPAKSLPGQARLRSGQKGEGGGRVLETLLRKYGSGLLAGQV